MIIFVLLMVICCDNLNKLNIENVLPKNVNIKYIELKVMNNTRNIKPINKCKYITHSVIIYVSILICSIVLISIILYTHYGISYKIITKEDLSKNA
ncbi:hypothetical protein NEPAR04_2447 [Nematocida parisii]|nr:hypothetical protein NEPAR04_2447 [Nematocida parisii]